MQMFPQFVRFLQVGSSQVIIYSVGRNTIIAGGKSLPFQMGS